MHRVYKHSTKPHPLRFDPRKVGRLCRATETPKIKWATQLDAHLAMANTNNKQGSNTTRNADSKRESRVYQCEHCDYWHTTHYRTPPKAPVEEPPPHAPAALHPLFRALGRRKENTDGQ